MYLREMGYENEKWINLVLMVVNFWILLPQLQVYLEREIYGRVQTPTSQITVYLSTLSIQPAANGNSILSYPPR